MAPRLRRIWLLLILVAAGPLAAADSLVKLTATPIASENARAMAVAADDLALPELTGPAAGLQPISLIEHYRALWLLAATPDGRQVWLRHDAAGWTLRAAPPASLRTKL